ncbi:hypothetical protein [Nostoc sp. DedSLP04]|uniref:hypothetical protein n=1 Tax=Nostoc sp. DedSLP04 TaxID=3075401 RepID=UPI002AD33CB9|nr:hypothetical protein [Nostoc sp. DedSLP04]MDZ8032878.1 hypothetical protein [Nostoc sp. DedSLP04]
MGWINGDRISGDFNPKSPRCLSFGVTSKKHHQKAIESLTQRITEHQEHIRLESEKSFADEGLIKHLEKEIRAFDKAIQQARKRLGQ